MRPRPARTRLLLIALLLLLQWLGRPAHALAMAEPASGAFTSFICGPDGLHAVTLDADGKPAGNDPKATHQLDCCDHCFQAQLDRLPAPVLRGPVARWVARQPALLPARLLLAAPRAPPQQPRAPPGP